MNVKDNVSEPTKCVALFYKPLATVIEFRAIFFLM